MPQLLHYLRVDRRTTIAQQNIDLAAGKEIEKEHLGEMTKEKKEEALQLLLNKLDEDIDWGTIDVYTCTASCSTKSKTSNDTDSAYIEETTYVQRPLSFERSPQKKDKILERETQPVSEHLGNAPTPTNISNIDLAKQIEL